MVIQRNVDFGSSAYWTSRSMLALEPYLLFLWTKSRSLLIDLHTDLELKDAINVERKGCYPTPSELRVDPVEEIRVTAPELLVEGSLMLQLP
jgi:hypothetical protein